jgi:enamine deaminase RidA (YjgF/YER057c/UK114 family)
MGSEASFNNRLPMVCSVTAHPSDGGFSFAAEQGSTGLRLLTGASSAQQGPLLNAGQAWLAGQASATLVLGNAQAHRAGKFQVLGDGQLELGCTSVRISTETLEAVTYDLYADLLARLRGRHLYRIWNYVPAINAVVPPHIENYRLFCSGRARAFAAHAHAQPSRMPAASGTGCTGDHLSIAYLAGSLPPTDWENPEQTPAYAYPPEYGPFPPSFSRATRVTLDNNEWLFVSGTAAIKGSVTAHPFDFHDQLDVTLENIALVLKQQGRSLEQPRTGVRRHFHIYLRNRDNLAALLTKIEACQLMKAGDSWTVVEADICRADLEVEIELTVIAPVAAAATP